MAIYDLVFTAVYMVNDIHFTAVCRAIMVKSILKNGNIVFNL